MIGWNPVNYIKEEEHRNQPDNNQFTGSNNIFSLKFSGRG